MISIKAESDGFKKNNILYAKSFWYKYIVLLFQRVFEDQEDIFIEALGDQDAQLLWDLLQKQEELVNSDTFKVEDFDIRLLDMGRSIQEDTHMDSDGGWFFMGKEIGVDPQTVNEHSEILFDDLFLPYLQLEYTDEIYITGENSYIVRLLTYHLKRNEYMVVENVESILSVMLLTKDSWAIKWNNENEFVIICDINDVIPIEVRVKSVYGEKIDKCIEIAFPFFQRNDTVSVSASKKGSKWILTAINLNNGLEYVGEINI